MHIVVIGAGLIGTCTAWALHQAGHRVTVVERREGPGLETSFANGGQVSLSHPEPWSNPRTPLTVLSWLGRHDAPLRFRLPAEPARWRWGMEFLRECLPHRTHRNTLSIGRLALYSAAIQTQWREALNLDYALRQRGILHLFFTKNELSQGQKQAKILQGLNIPAHLLNPAESVAHEPALAHLASRLQGALLGDADESGNALLFTQRLAKAAEQAGVTFLYGADIERLRPENGRITAVNLVDHYGRRGAIQGDAYVLCAGSFSKTLARASKERLPIYPVKGYSATVALKDASKAPSASITDESRRIVVSRLGEQLRIAGTAELNGFNLELDPARCQNLLDWVEDLFPGAADLTQPEFWTGLRPTTPSNVPIIGRSRISNLFFNTGHGTLGWTLACGSAQLITDMLDGKPWAINFPRWQGRK